MSRQIISRASLIMAIIAIAVVNVNAQSVVYDWSSDSKVPESYPTIRRRQTVTFRIRNVNKILYTYRLEITQTPIPSDDFSHLAGLLKQFRTGVKKTQNLLACPDAKDGAEITTTRAITEIKADEKLPIRYAEIQPRVSVPLRESVAAWNGHRAAIATARDNIAEYRAQCADEIMNSPDLNRQFTDFETTVTALETRVTAATNNPDFEADHVIEPGKNVSATVIEIFGTETVKTKTFTFAGVDVLTLSAGALFSRIPDRTYEARKVPGSELNQLTVEGNSRATPSLVALLNYSLGSIGLDHENFGLAVSAGPVLKLGNQSEASSFGFFTGISGHLYNRFYITPGIHFGQFADFPVGFSNGSTVPENFGQLDPVKRWTARFGLALSFKTTDFGGLGKSDQPTVTGDEGSGVQVSQSSPVNSPSPSSSPETATTLNLSNAPLGVGANFLRLPSRTLPAPVTSEANLETRERPRPREDFNRSTERPQIAMAEPRLVSSTTAPPINRVTSITNGRASAEGERIVFEVGNPITGWVAYFRNGRFFLTIPRAQLEVIQDGLTGRTFTDATFERRGDDLVISFSLLPGTKAKVLDSATGLTVDFLSGSNN